MLERSFFLVTKIYDVDRNLKIIGDCHRELLIDMLLGVNVFLAFLLAMPACVLLSPLQNVFRSELKQNNPVELHMAGHAGRDSRDVASGGFYRKVRVDDDYLIPHLP